MNVDLTQSELNELVYALGFARMEARMLRKDVADKLESKLYRALAVENVRIEKQLEQDNIVHDMNFKRRYIETGNY
jgi:ribosomal protein L18E